MSTINLIEAVSGRTRGKGLVRRAKIIGADRWGTSAYYKGDVLQRDVGVVTAGTKIYENHMTEAERENRPEGAVQNMVGKLISPGEYEHNGVDGPGIYADVKFYESYGDRIDEIADDIGLSIDAYGDTELEEIDGRYGPVLQRLTYVNSVDVVTQAGAGGKLVSIIESAGPLAGTPIERIEPLALTKEDLDAFGTSLIEAMAASQTALIESLVPKAPEPVVEPVVDVEPAAELDNAAILAAVLENELPAAVLPTIVTSVREGASIADAVAGQVALREAFTANRLGDALLIESASTVDTRDQVLALLG